MCVGLGPRPGLHAAVIRAFVDAQNGRGAWGLLEGLHTRGLGLEWTHPGLDFGVVPYLC